MTSSKTFSNHWPWLYPNRPSPSYDLRLFACWLLVTLLLLDTTKIIWLPGNLYSHWYSQSPGQMDRTPRAPIQQQFAINEKRQQRRHNVVHWKTAKETYAVHSKSTKETLWFILRQQRRHSVGHSFWIQNETKKIHLAVWVRLSWTWWTRPLSLLWVLD